MTPRRAALVLVVLLACPACGEVQEAEPLSKTVPVAAALVVSALVIAVVVVRGTVARWTGRGTGSAPPLTYPRATVALMLAPAVVGTVGIVGGLSSAVAFGYRDAHSNLFTWDETLVFAAVATAGALLVLAASAAVALGLLSTHRRERWASQVVLGLAIAASAVIAPGLGAVWLPAAIACSFTGGRRPAAHRSGEAPRACST